MLGGDVGLPGLDGVPPKPLPPPEPKPDPLPEPNPEPLLEPNPPLEPEPKPVPVVPLLAPPFRLVLPTEPVAPAAAVLLFCVGSKTNSHWL